MQPAKSAQSFVPVKEVRNGVVVLKDDSFRGILMCSSVNFSLKAEGEQRAIIGGFQSFLNTLDFSVQIVVHSRKTDIRPYLALLNERTGAQATELMRIQLREYIAFIQNFIEGSSIMTKTFYVIVPYSSAPVTEVTKALPLFAKAGPAKHMAASPEASFEEHRAQLEQRMALVAGGLAASGIRAVPLGTEEMIELLYRSFNVSDMENPIRLEA